MAEWTHLHRLLKDMKRVADVHPDWVFMAADEPGTHVGWVAFPPDHTFQMTFWTIEVQAVRNQAPFLKQEWSQAVRTAAGRRHLIELIIGRPGRPGDPPSPSTSPPRPPTPSRYELLMAD